jgi:uncharacterized protein YjbI with pentapeptide repeats
MPDLHAIRNGAQTDLPEADLSGADLTDATLRRADLEDATVLIFSSI